MPQIHYPPRMADGQTIAYKLLAILQHIAPTSLDQQECAKLHNEHLPGPEQDKAMASALADGYLYGNWPWLVRISRLSDSK
jgi:hypothetical protein